MAKPNCTCLWEIEQCEAFAVTPQSLIRERTRQALTERRACHEQQAGGAISLLALGERQIDA
jgi:hypothetical protein